MAHCQDPYQRYNISSVGVASSSSAFRPPGERITWLCCSPFLLPKSNKLMASTSQQPNVVQAILDSLTRCFNPSDGDESNRCPHQAGCVFGGDKQSNGRRSSSGGRGLDKGSSDNLKAQYDADRYIHRKLEIFRTSEEDLAKLGIINGSPKKKQQQRGSHHRRERSANSPNTLICSSSDEIANLAKAHKSAAVQGPGGHPNGAQNDSNPVADFVNLLRDPFGCLSVAQQPFGLCFATPIRTASIEDVSQLSDSKLTAQEFEAREQRLQEERLKETFGGSTQLDIPDVDESRGRGDHHVRLVLRSEVLARHRDEPSHWDSHAALPRTARGR